MGYSIGSLNETQSHLCIAYDREYISKESFADLFEKGTEVRKITVGFMKAMVMHGSGVKNIRKTKSWSEQVWEVYEHVTGEQRPEFFRREGT